MDSSSEDIPKIDIEELDGRITNGQKVLDVRDPDEFATARIPGVIHIPLDQLPDRFRELDITGEICVVCAKGGRSAKAVEFLIAQGYQAINVEGGTDAWLMAEKPHEGDA